MRIPMIMPSMARCNARSSNWKKSSKNSKKKLINHKHVSLNLARRMKQKTKFRLKRQKIHKSHLVL